jgi:hypothetical protein
MQLTNKIIRSTVEVDLVIMTKSKHELQAVANQVIAKMIT